MQQFCFSVISEGEDRRIPIAVAGQVMVDIQNLITDIGRSIIRTELRIQNEIPYGLLEKFVLKTGCSSGDGLESDAEEGSGTIVEDALSLLARMLDFFGTGATRNWLENHFKDPVVRSAIASDLIALSDHVSGYVLLYGPPGSQREFRKLDRDRLAENIVSGPCRWIVIGNVSADPKLKGRWTFRNSRSAVPLTLSKDLPKEKAEKAAKSGLLLVSGSISRNPEGKILAVNAAEAFNDFPQLVFHRIITPDKDIPLLSTVDAVPSYAPETKMWKLSYPPLGIDIAKPSWDECVCAFHEYFAFLWGQYAESDRELEGEEKETRDFLLSFLPAQRRPLSAGRTTLFIDYALSAGLFAMSKRHLSQKTLSEIGTLRISRLLDLSEEAVRIGRDDRARRYVGIARAIGMKTRVKMPKSRPFCKGCLLPMMPGINCTVRLSDHRVISTCGKCGAVRRMPYLREQRK